MEERDKVSRVRQIREMTGCGLLDAKKWESFLWKVQKEINFENVKEARFGSARNVLVTPPRLNSLQELEEKILELESRIKKLEERNYERTPRKAKRLFFI